MSSVVVSGDTSGAITISAPAISGTNTLTLPAVTDTLVGLAATQTLTNKTLTAPNLGTPSTLVLTNATGLAAAAMPAGSVLQVVSTAKTDVFSTTSTSLTDVTGLSVSITPSSASNKVLILCHITGGGQNLGFYQLVRSTTSIYMGDNASSRVGTTVGNLANSETSAAASPVFLDSPSTTASVTYKIQMRAQMNTYYLNRSYNDTDSLIAGQRTPSSITVMEIKG